MPTSFFTSRLGAPVSTKFVGLRPGTSSPITRVSMIRVPTSVTSSPCVDVYYPTGMVDASSAGELTPSIDWLPSYSHGAKWGEFIKVPEWLIGWITSVVFGTTKIPIAVNRPLENALSPSSAVRNAPPPPYPQSTEDGSSSSILPPPPPSQKSSDQNDDSISNPNFKYPVIVFSHGLASWGSQPF